MGRLDCINEQGSDVVKTFIQVNMDTRIWHKGHGLLKLTERRFGSINWNFSDKKLLYFFHIAAQNIDCGTRSNRLGEAVLMSTHNLCFLSKNKKNNVYPVNPSFTT